MQPELDIQEVNATINELKTLDLKIADRNQIQQLLSKLYNHIGVAYKLRQGRFIQRGITLKVDEDFPKNVQRLSFNPNGSVMGRCNFDGESMFYGCIASDVMEGYHTTAFEILPLWEEETADLPLIRQHRMIVGNWILSKETEFITIGLHSSLAYGNAEARNRNNVFDSMISNYKKSILSYYTIDKFLAHEFSKHVPKNESWGYKISAVYVDMLKAHGHAGLIYPSVKSAGAGMNIIIFPDFVRDGLITFDRCAYTIFYIRANEVVNEWLMRANTFEENLLWKDDYNRISTPLRNYYRGLSDVNPSKGKIHMLDLENKPK